MYCPSSAGQDMTVDSVPGASGYEQKGNCGNSCALQMCQQRKVFQGMYNGVINVIQLHRCSMHTCLQAGHCVSTCVLSSPPLDVQASSWQADP